MTLPARAETRPKRRSCWKACERVPTGSGALPICLCPFVSVHLCHQCVYICTHFLETLTRRLLASASLRLAPALQTSPQLTLSGSREEATAAWCLRQLPPPPPGRARSWAPRAPPIP